MYKYFIAYSHVTCGNSGFGNCIVDMNCKILSAEILNDLREEIESKYMIENVVFINLILLT